MAVGGRGRIAQGDDAGQGEDRGKATQMSAFVEWLNSTEPATPLQGLGIVACAVALAVFNFWILFGVIEPWRKKRQRNA